MSERPKSRGSSHASRRSRTTSSQGSGSNLEAVAEPPSVGSGSNLEALAEPPLVELSAADVEGTRSSHGGGGEEAQVPFEVRAAVDPNADEGAHDGHVAVDGRPAAGAASIGDGWAQALEAEVVRPPSRPPSRVTPSRLQQIAELPLTEPSGDSATGLLFSRKLRDDVARSAAKAGWRRCQLPSPSQDASATEDEEHDPSIRMGASSRLSNLCASILGDSPSPPPPRLESRTSWVESRATARSPARLESRLSWVESRATARTVSPPLRGESALAGGGEDSPTARSLLTDHPGSSLAFWWQPESAPVQVMRKTPLNKVVLPRVHHLEAVVRDRHDRAFVLRPGQDAELPSQSRFAVGPDWASVQLVPEPPAPPRARPACFGKPLAGVRREKVRAATAESGPDFMMSSLFTAPSTPRLHLARSHLFSREATPQSARTAVNSGSFWDQDLEHSRLGEWVRSMVSVEEPLPTPRGLRDCNRMLRALRADPEESADCKDLLEKDRLARRLGWR